jgi:hypothetical protein
MTKLHTIIGQDDVYLVRTLIKLRKNLAHCSIRLSMQLDLGEPVGAVDGKEIKLALRRLYSAILIWE